MSPSERHVVDAMSPLRRGVYRVFRSILEGFARSVWRLTVEGRERLPVTGPFVLAPVHRSYVDFLVVGASVPRVMRFMAKDSLWNAPRFGRFLEQMGSFPVDRERPDRAALRSCEESLAHGDPIVMFPEGRRRQGDAVGEILGGPAWVACRNRVPVVPVGLGNTDRAMPIGAKFIRFARVRVVIGEPIYPDVPAAGGVPRGAVTAFSEEIRAAVEDCYGRARSQ